MKEVLIHIGLHKTGTTAIQQSLKNYRDDTTRYAFFGERFINHSIIMKFIFKEKFQVPFRHRLLLSKKSELKQLYMQQLKNQLNDNSFKRLIISAEDICNFEDFEKKEMLNFFQLNNCKCKILCFVRNPNELIASIANQRIKNGRNMEQISPNFKKKILPFIDNLGLQHVNVFDYSYLIKNNIDLIDFVFKNLGIKKKIIDLHGIKLKKNINESQSLQAIAIIYKLNSLKLDFHRNPERMHARKKIANTAKSIFALNKGFKKPDPLMFLGYTQKDSVEKDCKWLKDQFGIEYILNTNEYNEKNISKYFDEALNSEHKNLQKFFSYFSTSFNKEISLEKNLLNLFIKLTKSKTKIFFFKN